MKQKINNHSPLAGYSVGSSKYSRSLLKAASLFNAILYFLVAF